jgi:hypothetical protein
MASGLLLSASLILMTAFFTICIRKYSLHLRWSGLVGTLTIFHLIVAHYFIAGALGLLPQDGMRFLIGLSGLILLCISAFIVASSLVQLDEISLQKIISLIIVVFLINAILSLPGIDYFGGATSKPAFLFSEPSHFALVTTPFLIYYVTSRSRGWLFLLFFLFLWALYIENLTMLIVLLLVIIVGFRFEKLLLLLPIVVGLFFVFADLDYFSSRFVFSPDESNLSGLVFMQGWQNALLTIDDTQGWGVGFQQFGVASSTGEITEKVDEVFGGRLNLFDGGTTATKLLGEFGLFGAVIVFIFIIRAANALRAIKIYDNMPVLLLFAHCVNIGILIELFVRGVGYFSPGVFIYLIIYFCTKINKSRWGMVHG